MIGIIITEVVLVILFVYLLVKALSTTGSEG
jgi:hypothetical protein